MPEILRGAVNELAGETYRAGPPKLGARLLAVAGLVRGGCFVADIGCDHGKLAVWLALKGVSPYIVAVDNRPLPLARAQALVKQTACGSIVHCRLGDGLAPIVPNEVQDIVIAGMSGESMAGILSGVSWICSDAVRLVLVPVTQPSYLRRWLCENGFSLLHEVPVEENGRFYTAMAAEYTGVKVSPTALFCQVGLVSESVGSAAKGYIAARLAHMKKQRLAPLSVAERGELEQLILEVEQCQQ